MPVRRPPCPACGCTRSCAAQKAAEHRRRRTDNFLLYSRVWSRARRRGLSIVAYRDQQRYLANLGLPFDLEATLTNERRPLTHSEPTHARS